MSFSSEKNNETGSEVMEKKNPRNFFFLSFFYDLLAPFDFTTHGNRRCEDE